MWASDSSITMAMSKLQMHDAHHQRLCSQKNIHHNNNNNHLLHHYGYNNNNVKSGQNHLTTSSMSHQHQTRIVSPHSTQLPHVQQLPKSMPSTPLSSKHPTMAYTEYENYLFI